MSSYKYLSLVLLVSQSAFGMDAQNNGLIGNPKSAKERRGQNTQKRAQLHQKVQAQAERLADLEQELFDDQESLRHLQERCIQLCNAQQQLRQDHNALALSHQHLGNKTALTVQRVREIERQETALKYSCVCKAARKGHLPSLMILHQNGKTLEKEDKKHYRPLQLAALMGHTDVVRYLLDSGANVQEQGSRGKTPVYLSTRFDHPAARETTQLLLDRGASLNQENEKGRYNTALGRFLARGTIGHGNIVINNSSVVLAVRGLAKVPSQLKGNCLFNRPNQAMVDQLLQQEPGIIHCSRVICEALASQDPAWIGTLLARGFAVDAALLLAYCLTKNYNCAVMLAPFAQNNEVVAYYNVRVIDAVKRRDFKNIIALLGEGAPFGPEIFKTIFYGNDDLTGVRTGFDQHLFGLLFDILGLQCGYLTQEKSKWEHPQFRLLDFAGKELKEYFEQQRCSQNVIKLYENYKKRYKP